MSMCIGEYPSWGTSSTINKKQCLLIDIIELHILIKSNAKRLTFGMCVAISIWDFDLIHI